MTAVEILTFARQAGIRLEAHGDRLRIQPAARVSPELREAITEHKPEILALLAPHQYVTLKHGLTLPLPALQLAWSLEDRGIELRTDEHHQLVTPSGPKLTDADRAGIARWHRHLAAIVEYVAPEIA